MTGEVREWIGFDAAEKQHAEELSRAVRAKEELLLVFGYLDQQCQYHGGYKQDEKFKNPDGTPVVMSRFLTGSVEVFAPPGCEPFAMAYEVVHFTQQTPNGMSHHAAVARHANALGGDTAQQLISTIEIRDDGTVTTEQYHGAADGVKQPPFTTCNDAYTIDDFAGWVTYILEKGPAA